MSDVNSVYLQLKLLTKRVTVYNVFTPTKMIGTSVLKEPKILCVGQSCFDIVQLCEEYVKEDTKKRCIDLRYQRGGNASNSCTVISQLGWPVEFLGMMGDDEFSQFLRNDLCKSRVDFSHCPITKDGGCPTSTIILSARSGSRTIIHHDASIGELTLRDFEKLDLREYGWIHFEGRNIPDILSMIQRINNYNESLLLVRNENRHKESSINSFPITVSVELEQTDPKLLQLLPHAHVAFISKDFAESRGYNSMSKTIKEISQYSKTRATIFNAWGNKGAIALAPDGSIVQSPPFPPEKVIDTLGAGDTFNASILFFLNKQKLAFIQSTTVERKIREYEFISQEVVRKAVLLGCQLAGAKTGLRGYDGLKTVYENLRLRSED